MRSSILRALLAAALTLPAAAAAQISGVVLEASGRPVPGASVEAWSAARRLAVTSTGPDGAFRFPDALPQATSVAAHRIGFQSATVGLRPGMDATIHLVSTPLLLDGLVVRSTQRRRICPNRDAAAARTLWERARSLYAAPAVLPRVELKAERYEGDVPREGIGVVGAMTPYHGGFTTNDLLAARAPDGTFGGAYARRSPVDRNHWELAPLAWGMSPHFVTETFGRLHTFSVVAERPDGVVIGFCPRRRGMPGIEGTLTVAASGGLTSARWIYRTPRPSTEAGGEADYLPPHPETGRLLLARRGLFWRAWRGAFHFREDRYTDWIVLPAAP